MHQPALCSTPTFCREVYFARMFDLFFWIWILLACLDPDPKKVSFCKNLLLCHFPAFFSSFRSGATHTSCKVMGSMIFAACQFTMLIHITPNVSSSRVATTTISKCNAMPLVRVGPTFQHKSCAKEEGVWTLHFLSTLQKDRPKISLSPVPFKKDGLLLKDNWGLSEKNAGKWQSST